jgi:predicted Rossmann-fold nucleotide-binding protein
LLDWMKETMLRQHGTISPKDLDLLKIADTAGEVVEHLLHFYSRKPLEPNF